MVKKRMRPMLNESLSTKLARAVSEVPEGGRDTALVSKWALVCFPTKCPTKHE